MHAKNAYFHVLKSREIGMGFVEADIHKGELWIWGDDSRWNWRQRPALRLFVQVQFPSNIKGNVLD